MGEDFLDRVSIRSNFGSIKEASGDINRLHRLTNNDPAMELSCGAGDQALEFFVWGATSWVTPMGNFFAGTDRPPLKPLEESAKDRLRDILTTTRSAIQTILSKA